MIPATGDLVPSRAIDRHPEPRDDDPTDRSRSAPRGRPVPRDRTNPISRPGRGRTKPSSALGAASCGFVMPEGHPATVARATTPDAAGERSPERTPIPGPLRRTNPTQRIEGLVAERAQHRAHRAEQTHRARWAGGGRESIAWRSPPCPGGRASGSRVSCGTRRRPPRVEGSRCRFLGTPARPMGGAWAGGFERAGRRPNSRADPVDERRDRFGSGGGRHARDERDDGPVRRGYPPGPATGVAGRARRSGPRSGASRGSGGRAESGFATIRRARLGPGWVGSQGGLVTPGH